MPANTQDDAAIPIGWKLVTVPSGTQNDELVAAGWKLLTVQPISTDVQTYPAGFIFNGQELFLNITAKIAIVISVRHLYNDSKEEEHEKAALKCSLYCFPAIQYMKKFILEFMIIVQYPTCFRTWIHSS